MSADSSSSPSFPRLTAAVRQQLLDQNEGLSFQTYYQSRNSREARTYAVEDGMLQIHAHGKGAFGGSQYDRTWTATQEEVHSAIYNHRLKFDYSGVDPKLPLSVEQIEKTAVGLIPKEVMADLKDDASPEAQSRFSEWIEGLSPREKLIVGAVVVTVITGGVVIYRYRYPITARVMNVIAAARRRLSPKPRDGDA